MQNQNAGQPAANTTETATPTSVESTTLVAAPETKVEQAPENKAQTNPSLDNTSVSGQGNVQQNQPNQTQSNGLSDQAKNYLQSQQIDLKSVGIDPNNQIAVDAFIAGHKAMRNNNNKQQSKEETQVTPKDLMGKEQNQVQQEQPHKFREIDILNVQNILKSEYSDVDPSKLGTTEFYNGMRELGITPVTADGDLNLTNIRRYAQIVADREKLNSLQQNMGKPTSSIPTSSDRVVPVDESANTVDKMTVNAAERIVIDSNRAKRYGKPVHPQYTQAVDFLNHINSPKS